MFKSAKMQMIAMLAIGGLIGYAIAARQVRVVSANRLHRTGSEARVASRFARDDRCEHRPEQPA